MRNLLLSVCVMVFVLAVAGVQNVSANYTLSEFMADRLDSVAPPYVFTNAGDGYGYELQMMTNTTPGWTWHVPVFTLTNTSTNAWAKVTSLEITVGDTQYNFDHLGVLTRKPVGDLPPRFTSDLNSDGSYFNQLPDYQDAVLRSDFIHFDFSGFDNGDVFTFISDIDVDGPGIGSVEDLRTILWNNGQYPNSEITVTFATIPAPGAVFLGTLGVGFVSWLRRRRTL
jgi:hypothetical protein